MAGGVYHTGDLAYRDENGYAYFAGRLGDWMRVDGENLGTAPIERILLRYPDVVEVAVYAIPDPAVGDRVMAALVLRDGTAFESRPASRRSWPSNPTSARSSGRRSSGSEPRFRGPRRSRSSSGSCPRRAPSAPTRSSPFGGPDRRCPAVAWATWDTANSRRPPRSATSSRPRGYWTAPATWCGCCRTGAWTSSGWTVASWWPARTPPHR